MRAYDVGGVRAGLLTLAFLAVCGAAAAEVRNPDGAALATAGQPDDAAFARAKSGGAVEAFDGCSSPRRVCGHETKARRLWVEAARRKRGPLPGTRFRDCAGCPEMVVVPSGSFMMGSPSKERKRYDNEGPVHRVSIANPFAVGVYEVTFGEWDACVSEGGCGRYRPDDEDWGRGRRPVVNVSWKDAQAYVEWLSRKTGKEYRLLSESEWEYAARAGTTGPFHTGTAISRQQANYDGYYVYSDRETGLSKAGGTLAKTTPVGEYPPNGFGLHDMHGNVFEWVSDCWNGSYRGAPTDGSAWESGDCRQRVLRGGSWLVEPWNLRSANRSRPAIGYRSDHAGFRVARTLAP